MKSLLQYLVLYLNNWRLTQSNVSASLTASFKKAKVFNLGEYKRVSCTRIRVACAIFACNEGNIDMGYLAKRFTKNREQTTAIHYNMLANHRDALYLASLIGDSFQIYSGEIIKVPREQIEDLTTIVTKKEAVT